jgi:superfamily II DNA or RNA helicase
VATGGGKTEIIIALSKILNCRTFILVTGIKPLDQFRERFKKYGLDEDIGVMWSGEERDLSKRVIISTTDSALVAIKRQDEEFLGWMSGVKLLMLDEAHHAPAMKWTAIVERCPAPFRFGFSGTPFESLDGQLEPRDYYLIGLTGETLVRVPAWVLVDLGILARPIVSMIPIMYPRLPHRITKWSWVYDHGIVNNNYRNHVACSLARQLQGMGMKVLMLVVRIPHGERLLSILQDPYVKFSYGGEAVKKWTLQEGAKDFKESTRETLQDLVSMDAGIFIGSTVYDEVVDVPDVNALIILSAMRKYRRSVQRVGRALRAKSGMNETFIFDFSDHSHYFLRNQSEARIGTYSHDDYRYPVHLGLDAVNRKLPRPLRIDVDPSATLRRN